MVVSLWSSIDSGLSFSSICPIATPNVLYSPTVSAPSSVLSSHTPCQSAPDSALVEDKRDKVDYSDNVEDVDAHVLFAAMWRPALREGPLYIELHTVDGELSSPRVDALMKKPHVRVRGEQVEYSRSWIHVLVVLGSLLALCVGAPITFLLASLAQSTTLSETAIYMMVFSRYIAPYSSLISTQNH